jgi:YjbE family integral membrane protein
MFFLEEAGTLIKIIFIDLVLSADNAVIIGMAASQFNSKIRQKVLIIGTILAIVFRIFFAATTVYLMEFQGIRIIGGTLLFWVAYKLYTSILKSNDKDLDKFKIKQSERSNFIKALIVVTVADIVLSLDNVIAVVGAAKENYLLLAFGLGLTIILMTTIANAISNYLQKNKWLGWIGLLTVIWVASDLIWKDFYQIFISRL